MITHNEMMGQLMNPEFSKSELGVLNRLEKLFDGAISERFDGSNAVYVNDELVGSILDGFTGTRRQMIMNRFQKSYETAGWSISFSNDRDGGCWTIKSK